MEINWVKEFNKLFADINQQGTPDYFSGPRFIDIVREFDNHFPDYYQYLEIRNSKGLSTSRKVYFYDILMGFEENMRVDIVKRIRDEINPSPIIQQPKEIFVEFYDKLSIIDDTIPASEKNPKVFISYS